jgi:hypothetical protein
MTEVGWRPLSLPRQKLADSNFLASPFGRFARVHVLAVITDTCIVVALAGSLFFSIPTGQARGRVALYLVLTIAPFTVIAPLIGPAIDRALGGRRLMIILATASRAVVCILMAGSLDNVTLFLWAFLALVLGKAYGIAKSALVPALVENDSELVMANSRVVLLSSVMGMITVPPAALLSKVVGAEAVLVVAAVASVGAAFMATRLPAVQVAANPPDSAETHELRGANVVLAATAMGLVRGVVGFLTFMLAFDLRGGGADGPVPVGLATARTMRAAADTAIPGLHAVSQPDWHLAVAAGASVTGSFLGAAMAPKIRELLVEERIILGGLGMILLVGVFSALLGGLLGAAALSFTVGLSAGCAKLAFDALVQRDAPDANFGRSFARFETRFQLIWVIGAFIPVVVPIPSEIGFVLVAAAAGFALFGYVAGLRSAQHHHVVGFRLAADGG